VTTLHTASRLKVLRECLRKHFYRYKLGISTPATDVMRFGTVGHKALEVYFRAWKDGADAEMRLRVALLVVDELPGAFERAKLRALIAAYDARWSAQPWRILEVEVEFRYELGGFLVGGKIDAIVQDTRDGRIYVLEHKTTGQDASPGSAYWERLTLDSQVSIYIDGAAMLGYDVAGCIYDVLQRPKHDQLLATPAESRKYTAGKGCKICGGNLQGKQGRGSYTTAEGVTHPCAVCKGTGWRHDEHGQPELPRLYANQRAHDEAVEDFEIRVIDAIAENPDAFLVRGQVVRLNDELPRMRQDIIDTIKLGQAAELFDLHFRNPDACARYGTLCSFFAACSGRSDINDERLWPRGQSHPELANAA
jgi:hypothetical protein